MIRISHALCPAKEAYEVKLGVSLCAGFGALFLNVVIAYLRTGSAGGIRYCELGCQ